MSIIKTNIIMPLYSHIKLYVQLYIELITKIKILKILKFFKINKLKKQ